MDEGSKNIMKILETPIEYYFDAARISARAFNLCQYNDINNVGDLIRYHADKGIKSIRNCGKKSLEELLLIIETVNFENAIQILEKQDQYSAIPEVIKHLFENSYLTPLPSFSENCIEQFFEEFKRPDDFYSFFCLKQYELADRFIGIKTIELKQYCYQLLTNIITKVKSEHLDGSYSYEFFVIAKTIIWFCDDPFVVKLEETDQIIRMKKEMILGDFEERFNTLSSRARTVFYTKTPNYLMVVSLLNSKESQWKDWYFPERTMKGTASEVIAFLTTLKTSLLQYISLEDVVIGKKFVLINYPFLTDEQCGFVYNYRQQHRHYPMFFILQQYLTKTKKKAEIMFADATGIIDGRFKTQNEIAKATGNSRESVRQILKTGSKKLFLDKDWRYYHFEETDIITQDNAASTYQSVVNNEIAYLSFDSFASICSLGFDFWIGRYNKTLFLINSRFNKNIINAVCREIEEFKTKKRFKDCYLQLKTHLTTVAESEKEAYLLLLRDIIKKAYGLTIGKTEKIFFPKTCLNIEDNLCEILRKEDRPLSFNILYQKLLQRNSGHKTLDPIRVRQVIQHSKKFNAIGLTSHYALAEWSDVYTGSIRDLVAQLLLEADKPMYIDEIMPKVLQVYPNTNRRSVSSSLNLSDRFISLGYGYFGLAENDYEGFVPEQKPKKKFQITLPKKTKEAKKVKKEKIKDVKDSNKVSSSEETGPNETKTINTEPKKVQQPETQIEFQRKCRQYLEFVISHSIPTPETNQYLFLWFNEVITKIDELEEEKRIYFEEMVAVLRKRGISI